jgi:hypothetical protein
MPSIFGSARRYCAALAFALTLFTARFLAAFPDRDPLADLAWLAGDWSGDDGGTWNEERWTEPRGGMMLAVHRDTPAAGGKATSFEFLRIEATPEGIVYFASPEGKAPTPFRQIERAERRVVFENPRIDFPERILYWIGSGGELHARIEGTPGGKAKAKEWVWKKVER